MGAKKLIGRRIFIKLFQRIACLFVFYLPVTALHASEVELPPPSALNPGTIQRDQGGEIILVPPKSYSRIDMAGSPSSKQRLTSSLQKKSTSGEIVFRDTFEYKVGREDRNALKIFKKHGWFWAKTHQVPESGRHPRGYIYTTDTIPGGSNAFPGRNSKRILVLEALPTSLGNRQSGHFGDMQTDFYLQYGDGSKQDAIPADVWFQFWVYPTGNFDRGMKFLYPCNGNFPCHDLKWLLTLGTTSQEPYWEESGIPGSRLFLSNSAWGPSGGPRYHASRENGTFWRIGQTNINELLPVNRWTKVIIHYDTSGKQGAWEAWLQPFGGQRVKVAEWIGGVTPDFEWPISNPGGHRLFRMPTTVGGYAATKPGSNFDSIIYIDDFIVATSSSVLEEY